MKTYLRKIGYRIPYSIVAASRNAKLGPSPHSRAAFPPHKYESQKLDAAKVSIYYKVWGTAISTNFFFSGCELRFPLLSATDPKGYSEDVGRQVDNFTFSLCLGAVRGAICSDL